MVHMFFLNSNYSSIFKWIPLINRLIEVILFMFISLVKVQKSWIRFVAGVSGSTRTWRGSKPTTQVWESAWSVRNCRRWARPSHWASPPPPSPSPPPSRSEPTRQGWKQTRTELNLNHTPALKYNSYTFNLKFNRSSWIITGPNLRWSWWFNLL